MKFDSWFILSSAAEQGFMRWNVQWNLFYVLLFSHSSNELEFVLLAVQWTFSSLVDFIPKQSRHNLNISFCSCLLSFEFEFEFHYEFRVNPDFVLLKNVLTLSSPPLIIRMHAIANSLLCNKTFCRNSFAFYYHHHHNHKGIRRPKTCLIAFPTLFFRFAVNKCVWYFLTTVVHFDWACWRVDFTFLSFYFPRKEIYAAWTRFLNISCLVGVCGCCYCKFHHWQPFLPHFCMP